MDTTEQVRKLAQELLDALEVKADCKVMLDEEGAYRVNFQTEETGLLIGFHGMTLESLQIILGIIVSKTLDKWVKVYVNVGDYREKREEALMHMAMQAAERVAASGRPVELSKLTASERRVVHMTLSGDEKITTESIGEGDSRTLVVKLKTTEAL